MDLKVPQINTNDPRVEVLKWYVKAGEWIEAGQDLVDLGTSKAAVTLPADRAGFVRPRANVRQFIGVGEVLASFHATAEEALAAVAPSGPPPPSGATRENVTPAGPTRFSPAAQKLIDSRGLDPARFAGLGLVTSDMIEEVLNPSRAPASVARRPGPSPAAAGFGLRSVPLTGLKRAEVDALTLGEEGNITCTLHFSFPSAGLAERLRRENLFDGMILPIVLFEIGRLLPDWPAFTAFYANDEIHYYDRSDLGLAVDMGKGLKVVALRDLPRLLPHEIFDRIIDIGARYSTNQLTLEELQDSTVTVTDLSAFGVEFFTPLINGRQSVIIGLGEMHGHPGRPLAFSVTFDHRVLSGRDIGLFMKALFERLAAYAPSAAVAPGLEIEPVCSRCQVDAESYYENFGRSAQMQVVLNAQGRAVALCHVCASGYLS